MNRITIWGIDTMKVLFAGAIALTVVATPVMAADMAVKAAPRPVVAVYNWTGFYIGVNGGWGSSRNRYEWTGPAGVVALGYSADADGGTVGGQIGYNWQAGSWVFGLEAQGNWADFNRAYYGPVGTWSVGTRVEALGLFTGRVGFAANNALFYVKGGAAVANNESWAAWNGVNFATASTTRWGAAVGAGFEWGFTPNWSFGVEYMHAWLGNNDYAWRSPNFVGVNAWNNLNVRQDIDMVTARINYRFGGPVVAKY